MPRQARLVLPGYLYHVTQRGNYRQYVFEDDRDMIIYLKFIQKYSEKYRLEIFAYCLMPNHVHFIVRPQEDESLAESFCRAHQRYSLYYHRKKKIKGHLWQERFYSCLLQGNHVNKAIRYVERNPVRANMVQKPWEYVWSSARAHVGTQYKIIKLGDIKEYINVPSWRSYLLEEEEDEELRTIRETTMRGLILGSKDFIKGMEIKLKRNLIPKPSGRPRINSDRH